MRRYCRARISVSYYRALLLPISRHLRAGILSANTRSLRSDFYTTFHPPTIGGPLFCQLCFLMPSPPKRSFMSAPLLQFINSNKVCAFKKDGKDINCRCRVASDSSANILFAARTSGRRTGANQERNSKAPDGRARARSNHHHHRSSYSSSSSYRPQSRFRISYLSAGEALAYTGQGRGEGGRVTLICNGVRRARGQRTRDRKKESTGGFFLFAGFILLRKTRESVFCMFLYFARVHMGQLWEGAGSSLRATNIWP